MIFKAKKINLSHLASSLLGYAAAIIFILFLSRSGIAIEYMKKGLKLCASTVIPSLFPFMVISELLVSSGIGMKLGRLASFPAKKLFGVSEGGACAFILGIVCGFPIGAKTLCSMLDRGEISKDETSRALTFCNNPGSAFVISAVGVSLFGSPALGIMLYVCTVLSAIVVGIFGRLLFKRKQIDRNCSRIEVLPSSHTDGIGAFVSAVQSSALSMLNVCALVAFFSSFVGCVGAILDSFGAPSLLTAVIFGFFELSSGVGMAAELSPFHAIILCATFCGWSGLSVHFQVMTVCAGREISFLPYFLAKASQGVICAALMGIALRIFPFSHDAFAEMRVSVSMSETYSNSAFVCCVFLLAGAVGVLAGFGCEKLRKKRV